uniref:Uncharacterized protein n=1 Tax=Myoviridae sp. ct2DO6 TaxID=2825020 RepID=A0A8S5Q1W1_9CAUD|nr:MAG TPA: hypothetical protein [Myoviridae sp. ct2DO6]
MKQEIFCVLTARTMTVRFQPLWKRCRNTCITPRGTGRTGAVIPLSP